MTSSPYRAFAPHNPALWEVPLDTADIRPPKILKSHATEAYLKFFTAFFAQHPIVLHLQLLLPMADEASAWYLSRKYIALT